MDPYKEQDDQSSPAPDDEARIVSKKKSKSKQLKVSELYQPQDGASGAGDNELDDIDSVIASQHKARV